MLPLVKRVLKRRRLIEFNEPSIITLLSTILPQSISVGTNYYFRTLASMFPDLDRDIIDDVVREKEGR